MNVRPAPALGIALLLPLLWGCDATAPTGADVFFDFECSIPPERFFDGGVGVDGIPALTLPEMVQPWDAGIEYLRAEDRVIGVELDGQAFAVPHNILWWHEIVNLQGPAGSRVAVSYCPLTGSSMVFDLSALGEEATLRVSGLLFESNLIMYDTNSQRSLWPQMLAGARCGPRDGMELPMVPAWETTWAGWQSLYPDSRVVSGVTGFPRDYTQYPYGNYERIDNPTLIFPISRPMDDRRPPKERVIGLRNSSGAGGIAIPLGELEALGETAVVRTSLDGKPILVLWESTPAGGMAYRPQTEGPDGLQLTLYAEDGRIFDEETGSRWKLNGVAIDGPLMGSRLEPIPEAYVAFWFAWALFHPQTQIWTRELGG